MRIAHLVTGFGSPRRLSSSVLNHPFLNTVGLEPFAVMKYL